MYLTRITQTLLNQSRRKIETYERNAILQQKKKTIMILKYERKLGFN